MATRRWVSLGGNENVLKLTDAQLCEHAKDQWTVHLKLVDYNVCEYFNKAAKKKKTTYDVPFLNCNTIYHKGESIVSQEIYVLAHFMSFLFILFLLLHEI